MAKTLEQVKQEFVVWALPTIRRTLEQDGQINVIARREVWANWLDDMALDGVITQEQAGEWGLPDELEETDD